ncbi:MAG: YARHG domain-containing protein [Lachnospiraceae bacterium]
MVCYAKNEIYARRGRIFDSQELNDYFYPEPLVLWKDSSGRFFFRCVQQIRAGKYHTAGWIRACTGSQRLSALLIRREACCQGKSLAAGFFPM